MIRKALRHVFEEAGWPVCAEASNGQEAITKAQEVEADCHRTLGNVVSSTDLRRAGISALGDKTDAGKLLTAAENLLHHS
jgi:hypothetical protein